MDVSISRESQPTRSNGTERERYIIPEDARDELEILSNKHRYLTVEGGGIVGKVKSPENFELGMVAVREDGWTALVDRTAVKMFFEQYIKADDWLTLVEIE